MSALPRLHRWITKGVSTACFLAQHGHDFHRWITKGVSYTTADVEEKLSTALPPSRMGRGAEADEARLRDLDKRQQIMTLVGFRRVNGLLASMQNVF